MFAGFGQCARIGAGQSGHLGTAIRCLASMIVASVAVLVLSHSSIVAAQSEIAITSGAAPASSFVSRPDDPGVPGPLAVSQFTYDLGDTVLANPVIGGTNELRGVVHYPSDLASGPYPLVLMLHGRHATCFDPEVSWPCLTKEIPSFRGYDYLGEHLASRGFVVVSVGSNGVNTYDAEGDFGMAARAHVIRENLALFRSGSYGSTPSPIPGALRSAVNLSRVALVGHSRGGEGVVTYAQELDAHPDDLVPSLVLPLAPVDFNRPKVRGVPIGLITPECDNDVADLQGVHFFDDDRMSDSADRYWVSIDGANHNYFNAVWSPESGYPQASDDFWDPDSAVSNGYCDPASGFRMSEAAQRNAGKRWITALVEARLADSSRSARIIEGADPMPGMDIGNYVASWNPSPDRRFLINSHDGPDRLSAGEAGGTMSALGGAISLSCGNFESTSVQCTGGAVGPTLISAAQEPHLTPRLDPTSYEPVPATALGQTMLRWQPVAGDPEPDVAVDADTTSTTTLATAEQQPTLRYEPSTRSMDISSFDSLRWRITTVPSSPNPIIGQSGVIRLTDGAGKSFNFGVDEANGLYLRFPPGTDIDEGIDPSGVARHMLVRQVRVPVDVVASAGVDTTDIASIEFIADREARGEVTFADLLLAKESTGAPVEPPPTTTPTTASTTIPVPRPIQPRKPVFTG